MTTAHIVHAIRNRLIISSFTLLAILNSYADTVQGIPGWITIVSTFVIFPLCGALGVLLSTDTTNLNSPVQRIGALFQQYAQIMASKGFTRALLGNPLH